MWIASQSFPIVAPLYADDEVQTSNASTLACLTFGVFKSAVNRDKNGAGCAKIYGTQYFGDQLIDAAGKEFELEKLGLQ